MVKDPFAMLSIPACTNVTGARAVLLYRHPGAMLASYRRMGWLPDVRELADVVATHDRGADIDQPVITEFDSGLDPSSPEAMGWFWSALYGIALADLRQAPGTLVVSHEELASGGGSAARSVFGELGLDWSRGAASAVARESSGDVSTTALHNLDRPSTEVATAWRSQLSNHEVAAMEEATAPVRAALEVARFALTPSR